MAATPTNRRPRDSHVYEAPNVPDDVRREFEAGLERYMTQWEAEVEAHVRKQQKPRVREANTDNRIEHAIAQALAMLEANPYHGDESKAAKP